MAIYTEKHGTNVVVRIGELTCLIRKEETGCILYYQDKRGNWVTTGTVKQNVKDFFTQEEKENTMKIDSIEFRSNATIIDGISYPINGWFERAGLTQKLKDYVQNLELTYSRELEEVVYKGIRLHQEIQNTYLYYLQRDLKCKYVWAYIAKGQANRIAMIPKDKYMLHLMERITTWLYMRSDDFALDYVHKMQKAKTLEDWLKQVQFNIRMVPSNEWLSTHGIMLKTGKFLRMCVPNIEEGEIQILAQHVQKCLDINAGICAHTVKVSQKPSEIYAIPGFTYGESCMSDKEEEFFKIYDDIAACSIAYIVDDEGELKARALLWETVEGEKIMDRIYAKNGNLETTMMIWAKAHGYLYKTQQAQGWHHYSNGDETITLYKLSVNAGFNFTEGMYECVPYMDTFHFIIEDDCHLYSWEKPTENTRRRISLKSTNGTAKWLTLNEVCASCGEEIEPDEVRIYDDETYCEDCFNSDFSYCDECDQYYPVDDVTWGNFDGRERIVCRSCLENFVQSQTNMENWCDLSDAVRMHLMDGREVILHPDDIHDGYCARECVNCYKVWDDCKWDPDKDGEDYYCPECRN